MARKSFRPPAASIPPSDPAFQALKALIIERTGHHYYADKDPQLAELILSRMAETGDASPRHYLDRLRQDELADAEWPRLESAVTINETFFFRFAEQFELLRRKLLPELVAANGETRRLRVWSVGCSTGAEPYSVAVLLHDLLGDRLQDWQVSILGTDIDEKALETARSATFSAWALRTLGPAERRKLFDERSGVFRLKPHYRGMVRFERHNMMALLGDAVPLQFTGYDLILCRNVLIYFGANTATGIVGELAQRLAPHGFLFLGHAESSPEFEQVARMVQIDGITVYRHPDSVAETAPLPVGAVPSFEPSSQRRPSPPRRPAPLRRPARARQPGPAGRVAGESLDQIRSALSKGDTSDALAFAGRRSGISPTDPVPHYLAALGALALGEDLEAEAGFRRALYLDKNFAMAHYLLGRHLIARGRREEGRRSLANALHAAAGYAPDAELPEGDGMTAAELVGSVRSTIG